jgi:hypothetical protein
LANWIKKEDPTIYCLQETCLVGRSKHWLRVKAGRRFTRPMIPPKQAEVAILVSDKLDFKLTLVKGDKEVHFILIKWQYIKRK